MKELGKVLDSNEKILWEGKPKFWPFFLGSMALAIFGIFWLAISSVFAYVSLISGFYLFFLFPHFWIGILLVFGPPIYTFLVYKNVHYVITDKRVIIQKGLVGRDFEMIDYDQITNAEVNVGVSDKLFGGGSGSILIATAGSFTYVRNGVASRPYTVSHIENPYDVFKFFKNIQHAVRTDIQFPNKYRPAVNPGYNTGYKPKR